MRNLAFFVFFLSVVSSACANEQTIRYRGQYSFGHEVNSFCPDVNSQCYWLGPDTTQQQRKQLKQLVEENTGKAYETICIVVEGQINRDPIAKQAIGFAADYNGLFTVSNIFGLCDQSSFVTQGDLQHHRWILESINGRKIEAARLDNKIPEIEVGEQMMASGHSGCNRFHGKAILRQDQFYIDSMASTRMFCKPEQNDIELLLLQVLSRESRISIDAGKNLILKTDDTLLQFRQQDRVG